MFSTTFHPCSTNCEQRSTNFGHFRAIIAKFQPRSTFLRPRSTNARQIATNFRQLSINHFSTNFDHNRQVFNNVRQLSTFFDRVQPILAQLQSRSTTFDIFSTTFDQCSTNCDQLWMDHDSTNFNNFRPMLDQLKFGAPPLSYRAMRDVRPSAYNAITLNRPCPISIAFKIVRPRSTTFQQTATHLQQNTVLRNPMAHTEGIDHMAGSLKAPEFS